MKIIRLTKTNRSAVLRTATAILKRGGVVVYPTETSYALGVDATKKSAVAKIFAIKGRDQSKLLSVLMTNTVMAQEYAYLSPFARQLWKKFLPGPLTIVVHGRRQRTIGIRVSSHPFAHALVRRFKRPITATSANRSHRPPLRDPRTILHTFFFSRVKPDYIIDAGVLPKRSPSTVVDCTGDNVRILRKGSVSARMIARVL